MNRIKDKRALEKRREEIIRALPGFLSQLLLLSDCGMVLSECLFTLAENYSRDSDCMKNYFKRSFSELAAESVANNESVVVAFQRFARTSGVKELTRVGNILMDNRHKGTDLWEKLEEQADKLWEERKRMALAQIKKAESKMSFPLAIMLIALIIVTSAPAFMQFS